MEVKGQSRKPIINIITLWKATPNLSPSNRPQGMKVHEGCLNVSQGVTKIFSHNIALHDGQMYCNC